MGFFDTKVYHHKTPLKRVTFDTIWDLITED